MIILYNPDHIAAYISALREYLNISRSKIFSALSEAEGLDTGQRWQSYGTWIIFKLDTMSLKLGILLLQLNILG